MLQMLRQILPIIVAATLATISATALAQEQRPDYLGTNRDWHAFEFMENGNRVCFMASQPTSEEGNYTRRGDVFVLITHRPAEGSRDVVSFYSGYPFEEGGSVSVTVDGADSYTLFTEGETAWSPDPQTDGALIASMRAGSEMVVQGRSTRGTLTTDTYSLFGFTATLEDINSACGL
ncbi:MAG: invasion associated locus B family protein [Pseudomonadota bacterium]